MKAFILTLLCSVILSGNAFTQQKEQSIRVIGTAEMEIVPDEIYISLTLKEYMKDKKKMAIEQLEEGLVNYLNTKVKVDSKDIKMENLDARIVAMKRSRNKEEMISKSYVVKLKSTRQAVELFVAMDSLGMSSAYVSRYSHSKMEEYKKQIKINAIKAAREKADYLMAAIGQKAGKAFSVIESSGYVQIDDDTRYPRGGYAQSNIAYNSHSLISSSGMDLESEGSNEIGEKTIKLRYSIEVSFLIE